MTTLASPAPRSPASLDAAIAAIAIVALVCGLLVLVGLPELLREFNEFRLLVYGAVLIVMMLRRPEGLLPDSAHKREMSDVVPEKAPGGESVPAAAVE